MHLLRKFCERSKDCDHDLMIEDYLKLLIKIRIEKKICEGLNEIYTLYIFRSVTSKLIISESNVVKGKILPVVILLPLPEFFVLVSSIRVL